MTRKCKVCGERAEVDRCFMWCPQCVQDFNSYVDMGGYDAAAEWGAKRRAAARAGGK